MTLLLTHSACLDHLTPPGHPERPDRLRAVERVLADERFERLVRVEAPAVALETIALCHPMQYITAIRDATPQQGHTRLDADTSMSPGSFEAVLRAVGGAVRGRRGFCKSRQERVRGGAPARAPCGDGAADGVLPVQL